MSTPKKYAIEHFYPYIRTEVFKQINSMSENPE